MRIGVNCGHTISGTTGSGAVGFINESDETRAVGYKVIELLREQGVTVFDCTNDVSNSVSANLTQIVDLANAQTLDLFVSIHFNSGGGKGCEVFTYGGKHFDAAEHVCENLQELGFTNRGIKDGSNLAVVRRSNATAMLIEVCFVDTKTDVDLYKNLGPDKIAQAICTAITGEKIKDQGELTMEQYNELKAEIASLQAEITSLSKPKMVYNYIDDNMPEWAREGVKYCVEHGLIQGTGEGLGLDDKDLKYCTIIMRLHKHLIS